MKTIDDVHVLEVTGDDVQVGFDPVVALKAFPKIDDLRFGTLRLSMVQVPRRGCHVGAVGYLRRAETRCGPAWMLVLNNGRH